MPLGVGAKLERAAIGPVDRIGGGQAASGIFRHYLLGPEALGLQKRRLAGYHQWAIAAVARHDAVVHHLAQPLAGGGLGGSRGQGLGQHKGHSKNQGRRLRPDRSEGQQGGSLVPPILPGPCHDAGSSGLPLCLSRAWLTPAPWASPLRPSASQRIPWCLTAKTRQSRNPQQGAAPPTPRASSRQAPRTKSRQVRR